MLVLLASGCISSRVAPGVLREDWNEPSRDPDPTRNPTEQPTGNPWAQESEERVGPPSTEADGSADDDRTIDLARRGAATILVWAVAGWIPLVEWSGTFEEDPEQRERLKKKPGSK
ncbi:MAG: hypothetical protein K8M05_21615 [Deltaproteobacteria bacterium]|nr:hypothetical protein [Kofleriaceae bacterium]